MSKQITAERLNSLGLKRIAATIQKKQDMKRRAAVAYEFYRVASVKVINEFENRMKERTLRIISACPKCYGKGKEKFFYNENESRLKDMIVDANNSKKSADKCDYCRNTGSQNQTYDKLRFTPLDEYDKIPPEACLAQLESAIRRECFDTFEVADVQTIISRPDPIIFGRIQNIDDRFFITQWDTDVDINDILK